MAVLGDWRWGSSSDASTVPGVGEERGSCPPGARAPAPTAAGLRAALIRCHHLMHAAMQKSKRMGAACARSRSAGGSGWLVRRSARDPVHCTLTLHLASSWSRTLQFRVGAVASDRLDWLPMKGLRLGGSLERCCRVLRAAAVAGRLGKENAGAMLVFQLNHLASNCILRLANCVATLPESNQWQRWRGAAFCLINNCGPHLAPQA